MKTCVFAALIALSLSASVSAAGLFITVGQHEVTGSLTDPVDSFFDVFFQIEEPVTLPDLAGYQVALDLNPTSSGVAFGAPINTESPHAPIIPAAPTDVNSTADRIRATQFLTSGAVPITDGAGIIRVPFQLAAGVTSGTFDLTLDLAETSLSDGDANAIAYEGRSGQITVVPEPSALVLGVLALIYLGRRRIGNRPII